MSGYKYIANFDIYEFTICNDSDNSFKWTGKVFRSGKLVYKEQTNSSINKLKVQLLKMFDIPIKTPFKRVLVEC